eukprot:scaffold73935_cov48-Phaeocystis_antarctica.AAC.2
MGTSSFVRSVSQHHACLGLGLANPSPSPNPNPNPNPHPNQRRPRRARFDHAARHDRRSA